MGAPIDRDDVVKTRDLLLWTLAAGCVRLAYFLLIPQAIDSADSILYLEAASAIAEGRFSEIYPRIPLLYPALSGMLASLSLNVEAAALVVSLLAMTALLPVLFALAHAAHGKTCAQMFALLATLWPWLVDYGSRVAPEAVYLLLWFLSAVLVAHAVRRGGIFALALAGSLSLLVLARPEGILIALSTVCASCFFRGEANVRLSRALPSLLGIAVVVALQFAWTRYLSGQTGIAPRFTSASVSSVFSYWGMDTVSVGLRIMIVVIPVVLGPLLIALLIPGLRGVSSAERDRPVERTLLLLAATQVFAAMLSKFAEPRYVMAAVIALSLWSARGAVIVSAWLAARQSIPVLKHLPAAAITCMMLIGLLTNVVPPFLGYNSYRPVEYKVAGLWMRENLTPALIISRKPQVGYYAGMKTTGPTPLDTLDDIHERAIDAGARYLVVDERYSVAMVPSLLPLLEPANAPDWLRPLHHDLSPFAEARIVIYEIVPDSESR